MTTLKKKSLLSFLKGAFFSNVFCYMGFSFLNKGIAFLLIPLFTRYLIPEDYGAYALFMTLSAICLPFSDLCLKDAITYVYYDKRFSICNYVSTFVYTSFVLLIAQMLLFWGLTHVPFGSFVLPSFSILAPLIALSEVMTMALERMWRVLERPIPFGLFSLFCVLLQVFTNVVAVVFLRLGWHGLLWAQASVAVFKIVIALGVWIKAQWLSWNFDKVCLRFGFKFGLGYFPSSFAGALDSSVGRFFLVMFYGLGETGLYSMGQKLGSLVSLYADALINVYQPWLYKQFSGQNQLDARKIKMSLILAFSSTLIFACLGVLGIYGLRNFILGGAFLDALPFIWCLSIAQALKGMYWMGAIFIAYTTQTWVIGLLTVTAIGLNIILTYLFVLIHGPLGAAYAPAAAWLISLMLNLYAGQALWKKRGIMDLGFTI